MNKQLAANSLQVQSHGINTVLEIALSQSVK